mgnify:CR=1 FL=1
MITEKQHQHNKSKENIEMLKKLAEARKDIPLSEEQKEKRRLKTQEKYDNGTATFGFPKMEV